MSELLNRSELNSRLAASMHARVDSLSGEEQAGQLETRLSDPEQSFTAFMASLEPRYGVWYTRPEGQSIDFRPAIRQGATEEDILGFDDKIAEISGYLVSASKWSGRVYGMTGEIDSGEGLAIAANAALNQANKEINNRDNHARRMNGLLVTGFLAAEFLPEEYDRPVVPSKRSKGRETTKQTMFRRATHTLKSCLGLLDRRECRQYVDFVNKTAEQTGYDGTNDSTEYLSIYHETLSSPDPEYDPIRRGMSDLRIASAAHEILERLASANTSTDRLRQEVEDLKRLREFRETGQKVSMDYVELDWTIFPPGTMEELAQTGQINGSVSPYVHHPERIKWLAGLAMAWSPDAYIAVSKLESSGEAPYYAAILPEQLPNGTAVEHAVAESPYSHNATYVFRAERGTDYWGNRWVDWTDALRGNRSTAKLLGARCIKHGDNWNKNVEEYLTRPADELDRKTYKR